MGKSLFVERFQKSVRDCLEELIRVEWGYDYLEVLEEDRDISGNFNGIIDITIKNEYSHSSVVGIEIEHKSSTEQAWKNIDKLKRWTHNSQYRSLSLLHIFNIHSHINHEHIDEMLKCAKEYEHKNHGFYYYFLMYKIDDKRQTKQLACDMVNSPEFKIRLWNLIDSCGLVERVS